MTCEDNCLHYEVCLTAFSSKGMYLGDDAEKMECFQNKADFVEVVRCGQCECFEPHGNGKRGICRNRKCRGIKFDTDFCSYGKRRDE